MENDYYLVFISNAIVTSLAIIHFVYQLNKKETETEYLIYSFLVIPFCVVMGCVVLELFFIVGILFILIMIPKILIIKYRKNKFKEYGK